MVSLVKSYTQPILLMYPSLSHIPRYPILNSPTPLQRLSAYESSFKSSQPLSIYIKRDDLIEEPFKEPTSPLAGNKARKLEYVMADIYRLQRPHLVCPGEWGSNTAFTTAAVVHKMGYGHLKLLLGPQEVTEDVKQKLLADYALGATLSYYGYSVTMGIDLAGSYWNSGYNGSDIYVVNPGASSDFSDIPVIGWLAMTNPIKSSIVGDLGFVNAFLELRNQLREANDTLPDEIYIAAGSTGSAAGLWVGACLTQSSTKIIAVQAATSFVCSMDETQSKAKRIYNFIKENLNQEDLNKVPKCDFQNGLEWDGSVYSPGYGMLHTGQKEVMSKLYELEKVTVDTTYSGKAFLAMNNRIQKILNQHGRVPKFMFWQTYNPYNLKEIINSYKWTNPLKPWLDLPEDFHYLF